MSPGGCGVSLLEGELNKGFTGHLQNCQQSLSGNPDLVSFQAGNFLLDQSNLDNAFKIENVKYATICWCVNIDNNVGDKIK